MAFEALDAHRIPACGRRGSGRGSGRGKTGLVVAFANDGVASVPGLLRVSAQSAWPARSFTRRAASTPGTRARAGCVFVLPAAAGNGGGDVRLRAEIEESRRASTLGLAQPLDAEQARSSCASSRTMSRSWRKGVSMSLFISEELPVARRRGICRPGFWIPGDPQAEVPGDHDAGGDSAVRRRLRGAGDRRGDAQCPRRSRPSTRRPRARAITSFLTYPLEHAWAFDTARQVAFARIELRPTSWPSRTSSSERSST